MALSQTLGMVLVMAFHSTGNAFLLSKALYANLEEDSLTMVHMDPSIIISTPYPLDELCTFVALSMAWNVVVMLTTTMAVGLESRHRDDRGNPGGGILASMSVIAMYAIIVHLVFVLCGVHPAVCPLHTALSSLYVALNVLHPALLFVPDRNRGRVCHRDISFARASILRWEEVNTHIFGPTMDRQSRRKEHALDVRCESNRTRRIHQYSACGTMIGMVAFSILRVLDHGMQIQRYPCPIIIGATWGSCLGVAIGAISTAFGSS